MNIPQDTIRKVAAIIPRLGSNHDGEIIAAAKAIERTLAAANHGFVDLADALMPPAHAIVSSPRKPSPDWKQSARWCAAYGVGLLNERALEFVDDLASSKSFRTLSPRQEAWLQLIMSKLSMRAE